MSPGWAACVLVTWLVVVIVSLVVRYAKKREKELEEDAYYRRRAEQNRRNREARRAARLIEPERTESEPAEPKAQPEGDHPAGVNDPQRRQGRRLRWRR